MTVARAVYSLKFVTDGWMQVHRALRTLVPAATERIDDFEAHLAADTMAIVVTWEGRFRGMSGEPPGESAPEDAAYHLFVRAQLATGVWKQRRAAIIAKAKIASAGLAGKAALSYRAAALHADIPNRDKMFAMVMAGSFPIPRASAGDLSVATMSAARVLPPPTLPMKEQLLSVLSVGASLTGELTADVLLQQRQSPAVTRFMHEPPKPVRLPTEGLYSPPPNSGQTKDPSYEELKALLSSLVRGESRGTKMSSLPSGRGGSAHFVTPVDAGHVRDRDPPTARNNAQPVPCPMDPKEFDRAHNALRKYAKGDRRLSSSDIKSMCLACYAERVGSDGGSGPSLHKAKACRHLHKAVARMKAKGLLDRGSR